MPFHCVPSAFGYSVEPLPSADELRAHYANTFYQSPVGQYQKQYPAEELEYFHHRALIALDFAATHGVRSGAALDLGCGEGFFLKTAAKRGFEIFGVDYSLYGLKAHNPDLLERGEFCDGDLLGVERPFPNKTFDLVFCKNVMEHVIDPKSLLQSIRSYLKQNGIAIIEVPNDFSCLHDSLFGTDNREATPIFCPPEHLHYFNPESLRATVEASGFRAVDAFGDYPIDHLLLEDKFNYYKNRALGQHAHALRRRVMALLISIPTAKRANLMRGFYEAGVGRDISIVIKPH